MTDVRDTLHIRVEYCDGRDEVAAVFQSLERTFLPAAGHFNVWRN